MLDEIERKEGIKGRNGETKLPFCGHVRFYGTMKELIECVK